MKKVVVLVLSLVMFLSTAVGSAFAQSELNKAVDELIGVPYKYAGTTENGFDCSGFTAYLFAKFNLELPHSSKAQNKEGYWIDKSDLRPGDLVFFNTDGKGVSHVGIYLGDDEFVHSASNKGVVKNKLSENYYKTRYVSARRILWDDIYNQLTAESK